MFKGKTSAAVLLVALFISGLSFGQSLEENWGDYLHYTKIGLFDLAKGYARAILEGNPDPVELLALSKKSPEGYELLQRVKDFSPDSELVDLTGQILGVIDKGNFTRRADSAIIAGEVRRLSTTDRGWLLGVKRLQDAGEYSIPFMLGALSDDSRREEFPHVVRALPQIGKDAIRPMAAALQMRKLSVKAEVVTAMGKIGYPQSAPYLKYVLENDESEEVRAAAHAAIKAIDPAVLKLPAAGLFYNLAEMYYYHAESLEPAEDADFGNIWFWDVEKQELVREEVSRAYFYELMAMRLCEWSLRADASYGKAIGLWVASFFKAESAGLEMPAYFGQGHADALVYATTAGVEYLHQALARAVKDKNAYVALGVVEALATTAGEKSLMYRIGPSQPLADALSFDNRPVRYSAAIAMGGAGPTEEFLEHKLVVKNLAEALARISETGDDQGLWNDQVADSYALRSVKVMLKLAETRNKVIDISPAQSALIGATADKLPEIQKLAGMTLAHLDSPNAQRAIAAMALSAGNSEDVRISAFESLASSAKLNANMLVEQMVGEIYTLIKSVDASDELRSAAAAAYGALNLPSQTVKELILDQAKS